MFTTSPDPEAAVKQTPFADPPLNIPTPDAIRAAIDVADERAKLLRRLLRVAVRLQNPPTSVPSPRANQQEAAHAR